MHQLDGNGSHNSQWCNIDSICGKVRFILFLLLSSSFSAFASFTGGFPPPQHKLRDAVILQVEFVSRRFQEVLHREASPDAPLHICLSIVERMRIEGELGHRLWCIRHVHRTMHRRNGQAFDKRLETEPAFRPLRRCYGFAASFLTDMFHKFGYACDRLGLKIRRRRTSLSRNCCRRRDQHKKNQHVSLRLYHEFLGLYPLIIPCPERPETIPYPGANDMQNQLRMPNRHFQLRMHVDLWNDMHFQMVLHVVL